jgi:hypothetical protein
MKTLVDEVAEFAHRAEDGLASKANLTDFE